MFLFVPAVVNCGTPPTPSCGSTEYDETRYGSTAVYRCKRGYVMVGSAESTCLDDGAWSNDPPTCRGMSLCSNFAH